MAEASASTSNPDQFVIPDKLLTLYNYESWAVVMHQNLERHDLWSYLDSGDVNCRVEVGKDKVEALEAIRKSCSEEMLPHIMYAEFAREAWEWLAETGAWTKEERDDYNEMLNDKETALSKLPNYRVAFDEFPEIDKVLTRRNYRKWGKYMETVLKHKYLWTVVGKYVADGMSSRSRSYKTKNRKALEIITMSCGVDLLNYIYPEDNLDDQNTANDVWNRLKLLRFNVRVDGEDGIASTMIDQELNELFTSKKDFENKKLRMIRFLQAQGLWDIPREPRISYIVKDKIALDAIKASCAPEMRVYILYMNCAKDAWWVLTAVSDIVPAVFYQEEPRDMLEEAANIRAGLVEYSASDQVLTRSNYPRWEEYVTVLLRSLFLYDVVLPIDHQSNRRKFSDYKTKEACALRVIKEACGREMMLQIFRSRYPGEALNSLRKACLLDQKDDYMKYSRLLHAVQTNKFGEQIIDRNGEIWWGANYFFRDFPEALTAEITEDGSTALHVAVRLGKVDFVKELLRLMTVTQTESKTHQGSTAIAIAAGGNNMEIVKMLVDANPRLPQICDGKELLPVNIAAINGNEMIMHYLYPLTHKNSEFWVAGSVASFLTSAARLDAYGIVMDLLYYFPGYALERDDHGECLLSVLAEKPSAFPSGNEFGFWKEWIYRLVPGTKQLFTSNEEHDHRAFILQKICSQLPNLNPHQLKESFINDAIHRSIINGTVEVFQILIQTNPYLEHFKDENGRGLFQIAIINRQESIFQYMSGMGQRNHDMDLLDNFGNNALHCAAFWDPSSQPIIHGPALQMQREIQWFQEVERVVPPRQKYMKNKMDNAMLTPKALFTLQHKDLAKEAEKWMKEMAQACIIVTALIATVMFAAPFTLPGGGDQNSGIPLALKSRAFKVFIVSDVISLIASCTSLLMFFSILTARYAEQDFLTSLPRRLILGLFTLFVSIATMMATFTSTVVIVLRGEAQSKAYIWVSILACVPVVIFALLQFRLFGNLVLSTYGHGILRSKKTVMAPLISIGYG